MKSGCRDGDLVNPKSHSCTTWAKQLPILEEWIDGKLDEDLLIGGDFNRLLTRKRGGPDPLGLI